jgi:AcrR family transcriptional regulator
VRFLAQGVEGTSAEQIAADVGVSLRTFYRHFASKNELLFGDYDASLAWFRTALESRPASEPITDAVLAAIDSFPFEPEAMYDIAALRDRELDRESVVRHILAVEAEFAVEVERHLLRQATPKDDDDRFLLTVKAHCVAAATFAAVDSWMRGSHSDLSQLAHLTELALSSLERGLISRNDKIDETGAASLRSV